MKETEISLYREGGDGGEECVFVIYDDQFSDLRSFF